MFITPVTVPLNWPPTSIGTAHAGPITNSRKKKDAAKTRDRAECVGGQRGGNHEGARQKKSGCSNHAARQLGFARGLEDQVGERAADQVSGHSRKQRNRIPKCPES